MASRPHDAVLGLVEGKDGVHSTEGEQGRTIPGLQIYRFDASLLFFNADHFKTRVLALIDDADPPPRWFLFDAESVPILDVTGADALEALRTELSRRGIVLAIARAKGLFRGMLERTGLGERIGTAHLFPAVHTGVQAFLEAQPRAPLSQG
jgi:MFS superfamily sulfate permease-like transporter